MVARKRLNGAAPPKDVNDPVLRGREAWERRKTETKNSWEDWKLIGQALLVGRQNAMATAKVNRPAGKKYILLFSHWIQTNGFDEIDGSDRSKLLQIMENLDEVEAWLGKLSEAKRMTLNHPSSVWRVWNCPNRGNRGKAKGGEEQPIENAANATEPDDMESEEVKWQRGLMLRARKATGDAKLHGDWVLPEPPDPGLIEVVWRTASAWVDLANCLEEASGLSEEEMTNTLPLQTRLERKMAISPFLTEEELDERAPVA